MADALHVWRDGRVHALLTERNGRLSLTYSADARPISTSLPVRSSVHRDAAARPWFTVSLLFDEHDRVVVAPIYDAMSTRLYETTATGEPMMRTLGMRIGGETDIDAVRLRHLVDEAHAWGMSNRRAQRVATETIDRIHSALGSTPAPIAGLQRLVARRIDIVGTAS